MVTDELQRLMQDDRTPAGHGPDLQRIHALGRRRRRGTRVAGVAAVLAVVVVTAGVWGVLGRGGTTQVRAAAPDHLVTGLTAYEKGVLRDIAGAYAVDGTVVLPDTADPRAETYDLGFGDVGRRLRGTPVALGFHGRTGPGYLPSTKTARPYLVNAPKGSQVVIDPGPVYLACLTGSVAGGCSPTVLGKDVAGDFFGLYGLGSEHFLQPGAEMELFTDDDWSGRAWHATLIGGFHGTGVERVLVELTDGTDVEAQVDSGSMSPGDTLFWARLPRQAATVRAYDASGRLVAEHRLRACSDPVDCEVR